MKAIFHLLQSSDPRDDEQEKQNHRRQSERREESENLPEKDEGLVLFTFFELRLGLCVCGGG